MLFHYQPLSCHSNVSHRFLLDSSSMPYEYCSRRIKTIIIIIIGNEYYVHARYSSSNEFISQELYHRISSRGEQNI